MFSTSSKDAKNVTNFGRKDELDDYKEMRLLPVCTWHLY